MKIYWLLLVFLSITTVATAQKLHKDYSFQPQEGYNVYFVHPQKGFESKDPEAVKPLEYDITYLSGRDSATYTFSYYTRNVLKIDSVKFIGSQGEELYAAPASMYFVQPKKKNWQQRASITIPHELLVRLYESASPYRLSLIGGNREINYMMKPKTWEKQSYKISRIFQIVEHNK